MLVKYLDPWVKDQIKANPALNKAGLLKSARASFVERMTANRAPVGLNPDPTLAAVPPAGAEKPKWQLGNIWGGRDVTQLTPNEFMERLGSIDVGKEIRAAAAAAGDKTAEVLEVLLKDIAQKFEGFGKDAATYFEGRARFVSVLVAIALAFFAHVDAVDLFRTYLRDPNARAKVIEQAQAVTAQHKAAQDAAEALKKMDPATTTTPEEVKKQVEALQSAWKAAINNTNTTIKQYADLGVPIGWTDERIRAARMWQVIWRCTEVPAGDVNEWWNLRQKCRDDDKTKRGLIRTGMSGSSCRPCRATGFSCS